MTLPIKASYLNMPYKTLWKEPSSVVMALPLSDGSYVKNGKNKQDLYLHRSFPLFLCLHVYIYLHRCRMCVYIYIFIHTRCK